MSIVCWFVNISIIVLGLLPSPKTRDQFSRFKCTGIEKTMAFKFPVSTIFPLLLWMNCLMFQRKRALCGFRDEGLPTVICLPEKKRGQKDWAWSTEKGSETPSSGQIQPLQSHTQLWMSLPKNEPFNSQRWRTDSGANSSQLNYFKKRAMTFSCIQTDDLSRH